MKQLPKLVLTAALGAAVVSCASTDTMDKSRTGAGAGAIAGGLVGAAVGDTTGLVLGAALGGLLGNVVGREMEEHDRRQVYESLESNRRAQWINPETGYAYEVVPTDSYVANGRQCRDFRMDADARGYDDDEMYGTACRSPDGRWEMLPPETARRFRR